MSNDVAIALIIASSFPGFFCYMYSSRLTNAVATEIVTGLVGGVPVPAEWRERLLYQRWVYYLLAAIGVSAIVAAINLKIARAAVDTGVQTIAYLVASAAVLVVLGWALSAISELAYFRRVLKRTATD